MAIKRLTDEEVGAIRYHAQNLLSTLCCPEGTAQCPKCQTLRGAFFMAVELQDLRRAGKGVSVSTVLEHGLDDTALSARPAVVDKILEAQRLRQDAKKEEPPEDATQEMTTVSPQD